MTPGSGGCNKKGHTQTKAELKRKYFNKKKIASKLYKEYFKEHQCHQYVMQVVCMNVKIIQKLNKQRTLKQPQTQVSFPPLTHPAITFKRRTPDHSDRCSQ